MDSSLGSIDEIIDKLLYEYDDSSFSKSELETILSEHELDDRIKNEFVSFFADKKVSEGSKDEWRKRNLMTGTKRKSYTRFEKARMVGARSLQIALGAPILIEYPDDILDPVDIAMMEYDEGVIPISIADR